RIIATKGNGINLCCVTSQYVEGGARTVNSPHINRSVMATRSEQGPIRAKGHRPHPGRMAPVVRWSAGIDGFLLEPFACIPKTDGPISHSRCKFGLRRAPRNASDVVSP